MQDAISTLIKTYDITGRYLDRFAIDRLESYYTTGEARVQSAAIVNSQASAIVKAAGARLFSELPELIRPGGSAYTTRRYATCLRDMDYYLRYATYAWVAGDMKVLDERVLNGLRETYNSLDVAIGPTVNGIAILGETVKSVLADAGIENVSFIDEPFDHMVRSLGETDV
ncbi:MAG: allophycocyanin subunit beta [Geitlerinemataceae cyanobacterium]